jgi:UDP-N-acetylglucosamine--N-acetylmuramyl-(pentapeptide) pyrophosphoryl-undecaprenol N-acetylglucosamine transferase
MTYFPFQPQVDQHSPIRRRINALVVAAGTGGHIMPGLAVAREFLERGMSVTWVGTPQGMEHSLVPASFPTMPIAVISFGGIRGKHWYTWLALPWRLIRAVVQSYALLHKSAPSVILAMGGYLTVPVVLANRLHGLFSPRAKVIIHEQNRLAGSANRFMARLADTVLCGFDGAITPSVTVGNPLNASFFNASPPTTRYASRTNTPMQLLVMGGSLGAQAINLLMPQALALLAKRRPETAWKVTHQSGNNLLVDTLSAYEQAQIPPSIQWEVVPFIQDVAVAMENADVVVCRAGAQTVQEIAAVGVAALMVPLPWAIDDHQTHNARYLSEQGAGTLIPQAELSADRLAQWFATINRTALLAQAVKAKALAKPNAAKKVAEIVIELLEQNA